MRRLVIGLALALVVSLLAPRSARANDPQPALDAFIRAYWDEERGVFRKTQGSDEEADFWWQAHYMELLLDGYEATHDPKYRAIIDRFFEGFERAHPGWKNDYNDDLNWWALALARAYQLTGEPRFKDRAIGLFTSISAFEDSTYGGGIWWKRNGTGADTGPQKNVATNAAYVVTAMKLYEITKDPAYLAQAKRIYDWVRSRFEANGDHVADNLTGPGSGRLDDNGLSYNAGVWIGANLELYEATNDPVYLERAKATAARILREGSTDGVLHETGDDDFSGMKGILTHYLAQLAPYDPTIAPALRANAEAAARSANREGLTGPSWRERARDGASIQSFGPASAAQVQFHANAASKAPPVPTTLGDDAPPIKPIPEAGPLPGLTTVAAAQATRHGLPLEGDHVAAWNKDGQWIDFHVKVPQEGDYTVVVHYSAGAGDASRYIYANGRGVIDDQKFQGTGAWSQGNTTSFRVRLKPGDNVISIIHDDGKGSDNYLNVSGIKLTPSPGQPPAPSTPPTGTTTTTRPVGFTERLSRSCAR